ARKQAGAVDKVQYQALYEQYQTALKTLRQQVTHLQQKIAEQKQQLIDQVQHALTLEQPQVTAMILKECQQKWKTLGSAARKQDQALWLQFRKLCDGFFNSRAEQYQQQQLAEQADKQAMQQQLAQFTTYLEAANT